MLATFFFSIMNVLAKYLVDFHVMQIVFFRCFGSFVFIFPLLLYFKIPILGNQRRFLFLRGLVGVISLATFFLAVQRIPLGSAISIRYLGPIFGAFLAYKFLEEKISPLQWISFFIAFFGVLLLKGFDFRIDLLSFALVIISAFFVGMVFVLIRFLTATEHYLVIINYFMVVSMLLCFFFIPYWRMPIGNEWYPVISIGIFGLLGQVFMTKAFQLEETSVLAPFKYLELLYGLLFGLLLFNELYTLWAVIAMMLIIGGMLLNVYAKSKHVRKKMSTS